MMLVSGLIECEVRGKISAAKIGKSVSDVLMDARAVKIDKVGGVWEANSCVKKRERTLRKLGVGLEAVRKQQTAPAA